jgi:mRNA interferase YafQ
LSSVFSKTEEKYFLASGKQGKHREILETVFVEVLVVLANDHELVEKHRDHALSGNWSDHRDCHMKPDLILIYRKLDTNTLQLVRLGSHSELSL